MKETKKKKIDAFLHEINSLLSTIPETPETEVCSMVMEEVARLLSCMEQEQALLLLCKQSSSWTVSVSEKRILCFSLEEKGGHCL